MEELLEVLKEGEGAAAPQLHGHVAPRICLPKVDHPRLGVAEHLECQGVELISRSGDRVPDLIRSQQLSRRLIYDERRRQSG